MAWSEPDRLAAIHGGCYVHVVPDHPERTFRVPGPAHLWRSLLDIATEGAREYRATKEDHEWAGYIAWQNGYAALTWDDDQRGLSASGLENTTYMPGARGEHDLGGIDEGALVITAGADVGARHIKVDWVAWGMDQETDRVRSWALRHVVIGDGPDDSIDNPELWEMFEREIQRSCWRRPDGSRIQAARILLDCSHRPELVRSWCSDRYARSGPKRLEYFGAQVSPIRGHHVERDHYPVNLDIGTRRKKGQTIQVPAIVFAQTQQLKDQIYSWMEADRRLPRGVERAHQYPANPVAHGYSKEYFQEMGGEVKKHGRTPQGRPSFKWERRDGRQRVDAWDCRVYALAALYVQAHGFPAGLAEYFARRRRRLAGGAAVVDIGIGSRDV